MKEIVSAKARPLDCPPKFEFNHMSSLVLWNLTELQGFFTGNHSLACPSLKQLDVRGCFKWELFMKQGTGHEGRVLHSNLQVSMQKSPFPLEEVIRNLEMLALNYEDASMILQGQFSWENFSKLISLNLTHFEDEKATFPYWFVENITTLQTLLVEHSSFKEMFQHDRQNEIQTRIKELTLNQLHELQHICKEGFPMDPILEILDFLCVDGCSKLKHLVPSSVTFSHLTYLVVQNCGGLVHFFTSSTARSLARLTTMKIRNCYSLEKVVAEEREELEDEINFSSLEILELQFLPMLKMFCSSICVLNLPLLKEVVVKQCRRMNIFSVTTTITPKLRQILSKEEDENIYWEGDLNRTVKKMFLDMVAFRSFTYLWLSEYPELRELWYSHVKQEVFGNLQTMHAEVRVLLYF
ncbi:uncharacterized protein LOC129287661 [Prosopis cineraria]|uniref:uncharacterized protein LOC129287661 n=1 Tax=Prosopis cineraria TaxID=364024 RepID=UPI00240FF922|nr:uncharacterized protein LOC129287661 [Prosopis cineraria]